MSEPFKTITQSWLDKAFDDNESLPIQVFESNTPDDRAAIAVELAKPLNLRVFCIEYCVDLIADPYFLLHKILTDFAKDYGQAFVDEVIDENVFGAHKAIFQKWLLKEHYFRHEVIIYDEAEYEAYEFYLSLSRILKELASKQKFLVVVNNIHNAPHAIIDFANRLLDADVAPGNYAVIGFVPDQKGTVRQSHNVKWLGCLNRLENMGLITTLEDKRGEQLRSFDWVRPTKISDFMSQIYMLTAAAALFAFEDVIKIVESLRASLTDEQTGRMLYLSGFSRLMSEQTDAAIRDFNQSLNYLQATTSENILMACHYWLTICFAVKGQEKYAQANQEQLEKLSLDFENQRYYVLSMFAGFYVDSKISQHALTITDIEPLKYLLSSLHYDNLRCVVLTQVYSASNEKLATPKAMLNNCMVALRIARESKNLFAVSTALQSMGVCHSRLGNNSQTNRLFKMSLKLRQKLESKTKINHMLNGLGNHYIGLEKWTEAWDYFDRALDNLINTKNYTELTITLYNYAWLYGQSGNFLWAIDLLNDLLALMQIRNIETLPFRNLKDVYAYKGWLHVQAKQPIQAQYCLIRFYKLPHLHATPLSSVLKQLLKSALAINEGNKALAIKCLKTAEDVLKASVVGFDLYMYSVLELETARLYNKVGYEQDAKNIFDRLRVRAQARNFSALAQRTSRASLGLSLAELSPLPNVRRPYRLLMDLAEKDSKVIELQHQIYDLQQANLLVELSTAESTIDSFLMKVIEIFDRRVPANHFVVTLQDASLDAEKINVSNNAPNDIIEFCNNYLMNKSTIKTVLSFQYGSEIITALPLNMKAREHAWLLVCGDQSQSLVWNKDYLQLVAQQLGLVLDRRLREGLLEQQNRTDVLTGILNRSGLFERVDKILSQMQRQNSQALTLCYLDLDHFKYFNDQFGHELGDKVLIALANLVCNNLRANDELGRIGGDEFVLLLPSTSMREAKQILNRIRCAIEQPYWWLTLFGESNEVDNPIDKEHWITASFGAVVISGWPTSGLNRTDLLAQADELMYHAKEDGRNQVCIKEFVDSRN